MSVFQTEGLSANLSRRTLLNKTIAENQMNSDNLTACPVCKVTWLGDEIPDGLMKTGHYGTQEEAEKAAAMHGWTPENGKRFKINMLGIEYPWTHPQHYDGVSEWKCTECGARIGRWSREVLETGRVEPRFGVMEVIPVGNIPDREDYKMGQ
jgi:hypothetical protein